MAWVSPAHSQDRIIAVMRCGGSVAPCVCSCVWVSDFIVAMSACCCRFGTDGGCCGVTYIGLAWQCRAFVGGGVFSVSQRITREEGVSVAMLSSIRTLCGWKIYTEEMQGGGRLSCLARLRSYGLRVHPQTHIFSTSKNLNKLFVLFDAHVRQRRGVGYTLWFSYEHFASFCAQKGLRASVGMAIRWETIGAGPGGPYPRHHSSRVGRGGQEI